MILRPYQSDCVDRIRAAFARGVKRPLLVAPTGSGKTVMFSYIASGAIQKGKRTCVVVHRGELLRQVREALRQFGIPHGVIAPKHPVSQHLIQVASVQTLVNRNVHFDFFILDEGHHAVASTWLKVLERNPSAAVLGVTATPCRMGGKGLSHVYDELIIGPTTKELTDQGYLSPARVYAPVPDEVRNSDLHTRAGDYLIEEVRNLMDKRTITGCAVDHYQRLAPGAPAIAFCVDIEHAQHVAEQFREAGIASQSIDGKMSRESQSEIIQMLARGHIKVVTSCDLISEGVDVPIVSCGILLRPTKSTALYLQQVGRCLRPYPGKTEAIILDHAGNALKHGLPIQDRDWDLKEGVKNAPGGTFRLMVCPICQCAHEPAPECPACGWVYEQGDKRRRIDQVDGELKELVSSDERQSLIAEAKTLQDFHDVAKRLGYKPGWAFIQHKLRRGKRSAIIDDAYAKL